VGHSPRGRLARSFETAVDQLLMHYLYTDALRIQLVRIVGLDAEPLGQLYCCVCLCVCVSVCVVCVPWMLSCVVSSIAPFVSAIYL